MVPDDDQPVRSQIEFVHARERIKVLLDDTRSSILRSIRSGIVEEDSSVRRSLTVPEVARKLGESASKIYHHVDQLVEHGFLRIAHEERKKRSTVTYYERTADAFVIMSGEESIDLELNRDEEFISVLDKILNLDMSPDDRRDAAKLLVEYRKHTRDALEFVSRKTRREIPLEQIESVLNFLAQIHRGSHEDGIEITKRLHRVLLDLK